MPGPAGRRGDEHSALAAARGGDFVVATVTARSHLLPALAIVATGVAATEPVR